MVAAAGVTQVWTWSSTLHRGAMNVQTLSSEAPTDRSAVLLDPLMRQLRLIYASKSRLAVDLERLFCRTNWLPLRLQIADQRRETNNHIDRLICLLPTVDGRVPPPMMLVAGGRLDVGRAPPLPATAIVAELLELSRSAVAAYDGVLAAVTQRGLGYAVGLLTSSRADEIMTTRRLAAFAAEMGAAARESQGAGVPIPSTERAIVTARHRGSVR
jgi:ferritin-like metal-binding protein YciE